MVPSHVPYPEDRTCLRTNKISHNLYLYPQSVRSSHHLHLMPMQVPWMTRRTEIVDNDSDSIIRSGIINIPIGIGGRIAIITALRQQKYRVTQIRFESTMIDSPHNVTRSVDRDRDIHRYRGVRLSRCDGKHGYTVRERVIETGRRAVYFDDRVGAGCGAVVCVFIVYDGEGERLVSGLSASARCDFGAHPEDVGGMTSCFDDNVCALADLGTQVFSPWLAMRMGVLVYLRLTSQLWFHMARQG